MTLVYHTPVRDHFSAPCGGRLGELKALLLLLFIATMLRAQTSAVPPYVSYQGLVSDAAGFIGATAPVNRLVIFRVWNHATSRTQASLLYSEQQTVTISKGELSVLIGQGGAVTGTPLGFNEAAKGPPSLALGSVDVLSGTSRYLGVTVDDGTSAADPEISPRQELAAAAFAFRAKFTERLSAKGAVAISVASNGNIAFGSGTLASAALTLGSGVGDKISLDRAATGESSGIGVAAGLSPVTKLLQVHTGLATDDITFGLGLGLDLATETMRIKGDGKVGIGTSTPVVKLDVFGGVRSSALVFADAEKNSNIGLLTTVGGGLQVGTEGAATSPITISSNGKFVGLGVTNPEFPLDVGEPADDLKVYSLLPRAPINTLGYYNPANSQPPRPTLEDATTGANSFTSKFSIRADGNILISYGFMVSVSDRRIKRDIQPSVIADDLARLRQLEVVSYRLVEEARSRDRKKGFIAQDLAKILPAAVTMSEEFVPDVFAFATAVAHDPAAKTLALTLVKDHGLKEGDRVRLQLDGERRDLTVAAVTSGRALIVADCELTPKRVFVYGKEVRDFLTVNYNHVFTVAVGALQELKRETDEEVAALKLEGSDLRPRLARVEELERARAAKLSALEMLQASRPQVNARPAALKPVGTEE